MFKCPKCGNTDLTSAKRRINVDCCGRDNAHCLVCGFYGRKADFSEE